jgi:cell division protein ZapA
VALKEKSICRKYLPILIIKSQNVRTVKDTENRLNIADDYFKAKKQGDSLESDIELKDKEMYDLKHELISAQIKLENAEKELAKMKEENNDLQMQIVKLETEMKNRRR